MCVSQRRLWISCVLFHEGFPNSTHKFRFVRMIDEGWRIPKVFYWRLQCSPPRHEHNKRRTVECVLYPLHVSGYPKTHWNRDIILLILLLRNLPSKWWSNSAKPPLSVSTAPCWIVEIPCICREHTPVSMFVAKTTWHNGFIFSLLPGTD